MITSEAVCSLTELHEAHIDEINFLRQEAEARAESGCLDELTFLRYSRAVDEYLAQFEAVKAHYGVTAEDLGEL